MSNKIYKYISPFVFDNVFAKEGFCTIKCSLPEDFNDPYELFLTINYLQEPEALAFYKEVIGEIPQLPVTCFSRSPGVIPMWAHYAHNQKGFVIEIDEEKFKGHFPDYQISDVDYRDEPNEGFTELLHRGFRIMKPRYVYMLQRGVFSAAYYSKKCCWEYEQEKRLVLNKNDVYEIGGHLLFDIPEGCVTAIISGARSSQPINEGLREIANSFNCNYLRMHIGKTSSNPYFIDGEENPYCFENGSLKTVDFYCGECFEPTQENVDICAWCQITEDHVVSAAESNPFRRLAHFGLLDNYIKSMDEIGKK